MHLHEGGGEKLIDSRNVTAGILRLMYYAYSWYD